MVMAEVMSTADKEGAKEQKEDRPPGIAAANYGEQEADQPHDRDSVKN